MSAHTNCRSLPALLLLVTLGCQGEGPTGADIQSTAPPVATAPPRPADPPVGTSSTTNQTRSNATHHAATADDATQAAQDREVLIAIYHATDGDNWKYNAGWLSDLPLEQWEGVRVDDTGAVWALDLNGVGLTGTIPPVLGQLKKLRRLNLTYNNLTGTIPPELGQLQNLENLGLNGSQSLEEDGTVVTLNLSGPIPPELWQLKNLKRLDLTGVNKDLGGDFPPGLVQLKNLEDLNLGGLQLTGPIPPELWQLKNLKYLFLGGNQLTGPIPPELGQLKNVEYLNLSYNQLTGPIPPELGQLKNVEYLNLSYNQLTGPIPPELAQMENLSYLNLSYNQLTGPIPPELAQIAGLSLSLDGNQLTSPLPTDGEFGAGIKKGTVRITNTSGGRVIVIGHQDNPKPVIVHFQLTDSTDLSMFDEYDFCASIWLPPVYRQGPKTITQIEEGLLGEAYCIDRVDYGIQRINVPIKSRLPRLTKGLWRTTEVEVRFELRKNNSKNGIDLGSHGVTVDFVDPFSRNIIFHAFGYDSLEAARKTDWLEGVVQANEHNLRYSEQYFPLVIDQYLVGDPLVISTTDSVFYSLIEVSHPGGELRDFHVAAITPDVWDKSDWLRGKGGTAIAGHLSAIRFRPYSFYLLRSALWHEIGHNTDLGHAPCPTDIQWPHEVNYPTTDGALYLDGYRIDEMGTVEVIPKDETHDFMSYCGPSWISAYSYRRMAEYIFGFEPTYAATRPVVSDRIIQCDLPQFD